MVSVCIATYNGAKYIQQQINSILEQLQDEDEIIVSDDCSTDDTEKIINSINDSRIHFIKHERNTALLKKQFGTFMMVSQNFENALKLCKGDVIFLCDQDDIWMPNKIQISLQQLDHNDIAMSNYAVIDENGKEKCHSFYKKSPISKFLLINIIKSRFLGCCMCFNKNVLEYCLPFPKDLVGHDFWIGCLGVKKFNFSYIEEPLIYYRRTFNNVSTAANKSKNPFLYRIAYRISFLRKIIKHIIRKW